MTALYAFCYQRGDLSTTFEHTYRVSRGVSERKAGNFDPSLAFETRISFVSAEAEAKASVAKKLRPVDWNSADCKVEEKSFEGIGPAAIPFDERESYSSNKDDRAYLA